MALHTSGLRYEDDWGPDRFNGDGLRAPVVPQEASVDGQGGTIRGKPVWTIEEIAFQLNRGDGLITEDGVTYRSGAEWFGAQGPADNDYYFVAEAKGDTDGTLNTLTFGFYESLETLPEPYVYRDPAGELQIGFEVAVGFSPLSAEQRVAARQAISYWDDLITVKFVETPFQQGDINFMNSTTGPAQAAAYLPYDYGVAEEKNFEGENISFRELAGDVYIATPSVNPSNALFDEGQYGLTTLIHELGHALGLEHPGAYNFSDDFDLTYDTGAEYYQDSNQYSIMSYWDSEETNANHVDWEFLTYRYPSTPLVHDIAAIQRIYGADLTTRTGNTVYGFNSNAGDESFDFTRTPAPVVTIWDAGGEDTLDFSGFNTPSILNLNAGSFSSGGGILSEEIPTLDAINARRAAAGLAPRSEATYQLYLELFSGFYTNGLLSDNVSIAYGVTIENATGGSGDDLLIANGVANRLTGGAGSDTASWEAATRGVTVILGTGRLAGGASGDVLVSIENLKGSRFADSLAGDGGNNVINGNGGGDTLVGGAGIDTLSYEGRTGSVVVNLGTNENNQGDRILQFENLIGGSGNDTLTGSSANNAISGGDGNDTIDAAAGNDMLAGGAGNDLLTGGAGNDGFDGGAGDDSLNGGSGDDYLDGGSGSDILTSGSGRDIYAFSDLGGTDTIADFRRGEDKLDFGDLDHAGTFRYIAGAAFSAGGSAEIRFVRETGGIAVLVDADGDGSADLTVRMTSASTLLLSDLILM